MNVYTNIMQGKLNSKTQWIIFVPVMHYTYYNNVQVSLEKTNRAFLRKYSVPLTVHRLDKFAPFETSYF